MIHSTLNSDEMVHAHRHLHAVPPSTDRVSSNTRLPALGENFIFIVLKYRSSNRNREIGMGDACRNSGQ